MDKLTQYRQFIMEVLTNYVDMQKVSAENAEMITIFDQAKDHYQVLGFSYAKYAEVYRLCGGLDNDGIRSTFNGHH